MLDRRLCAINWIAKLVVLLLQRVPINIHTFTVRDDVCVTFQSWIELRYAARLSLNTYKILFIYFRI